MPYIALKPVRFTKNYAVGELIPDSEINSQMQKNLINWGKIASVKDNNSVNAPDSDVNASNSAVNASSLKLPSLNPNAAQARLDGSKTGKAKKS